MSQAVPRCRTGELHVAVMRCWIVARRRPVPEIEKRNKAVTESRQLARQPHIADKRPSRTGGCRRPCSVSPVRLVWWPNPPMRATTRCL